VQFEIDRSSCEAFTLVSSKVAPGGYQKVLYQSILLVGALYHSWRYSSPIEGYSKGWSSLVDSVRHEHCAAVNTEEDLLERQHYAIDLTFFLPCCFLIVLNGGSAN
jgi:hypothetical protein